MDSFPTLKGTLESKRKRLLSLEGTSSIGDISTDGVVERESNSKSSTSTKKNKSSGSESKSSEPIEFNQEKFDKFKEQVKTYADLLDVQNIGSETDKQKRYRIALEKKLGKLENQDLLEKILEDYNGNVDNAAVEKDIRWLFDETYNVKEEISKDTGSKPTINPTTDLIKDGTIEEFDGKSVFFMPSGKRLFVIANVNGVKVPMYQSSKGTGDKTAGHWYPFFGIAGGAWVVKGSSYSEMENGYGIKALKDVQDKLNKQYPSSNELLTEDGQKMKHVLGNKDVYIRNLHDTFTDDWANVDYIGFDLKSSSNALHSAGKFDADDHGIGGHLETFNHNSKEILDKLRALESVEESEPVAPSTPMDTFNNLVDFLESQSEFIVDDIDTILTVVADTFADLKDEDKKQMTPALRRVIANVEKSIKKDVSALNELRDELVSEKDSRKANSDNVKSIDDKASWLGSKIDAMKKIISNIRKKIKLLGKKAYSLISDVEYKRKFKYRLQAIEALIDAGATTGTVMQTISDSQSLLNDIHEFKKHFEKIPKEKDYGLIDFFGVNLKTTFENHPQVEKFYHKVHSKLKNIKQGRNFDTNAKAKGWYMKEMKKEYDKAKDFYENGSLFSPDNTANFKSFSQFMKHMTLYGKQD